MCLEIGRWAGVPYICARLSGGLSLWGGYFIFYHCHSSCNCPKKHCLQICFSQSWKGQSCEHIGLVFMVFTKSPSFTSETKGGICVHGYELITSLILLCFHGKSKHNPYEVGKGTVMG